MNANEIRWFYETVYRDTTGYRSVFNLQTKTTSSFASTDLDSLTSYVETASLKNDVYGTLGTHLSPPLGAARGGNEMVFELASFFADIDLASGKDTKKNYPPDRDAAFEILDNLEVKPSLLIDSGRGLHVHYILNEPLKINSDEDRALARAIWKSFQRELQRQFRIHGYEIDSVGDLARAYRIPGTLNHKTSPPSPVTVLQHHLDRRYSLDTIKSFCEEKSALPKPKKPAYGTRLVDHDEMARQCAFVRQSVEFASITPEPDWYAYASLVARCRNGDRIFHEVSQNHPSYDKAQADLKLKRALTESGPRTCQSIESDLAFQGCQLCPHRGLIKSPVQLGQPDLSYYSGGVGPEPLGFTKDGQYALKDPVRNIIIIASPNQLLSQQYLIGISPSIFWGQQFPKANRAFDFMAAGEALIKACRNAGPFDPLKVRGRGIWLEGLRLIVNLGDTLPEDTAYRYICFSPIKLEPCHTFPTDRLLKLLRDFAWRNPNDAFLALGWLAVAAVCGALQWRPHIYIWGPAKCGKTTIHNLARKLLDPLVISPDGQSSEAGIRQTLGPDSLAIVIDEFESDQAAHHLRAIVRLARSASSADSPVLRGTPDGKPMQFSLRTTFFFSGINPMSMSPADESRIVLLELMPHTHDSGIAQHIVSEERYFQSLGQNWCSYMVGHAHLLDSAINAFEKAMPSLDRRHRQNMATLLAGAFVALEGRLPTDMETHEWASRFAPTVELHAEALDRDDGNECLDHLFAHVIDDYPLWHWAAIAFRSQNLAEDNHINDARRIMKIFDITFDLDRPDPCFYIRNGSPAVDKVFNGSKWAGRVWGRAIKKATGAFSPPHPIYFSSTGGKNRATGIPVSLLPEPMTPPHNNSKY